MGFGEGSFGQKLTAFAFGWAGGWGGSKAGGAFGPPTHKFPPRTDASDEALGNVMTAMEKAKNPMGEPWSQNDNRVFSVATHEDGSVSYAVSGEKPSRVGQIYESMEQHLPENYKPASSDIDMSNFKAATVRGNEVKGTPCAEPKLLLGNENQSPITGMSTGWRGKGPNPYQQGNTGPFMNGCASCAKNAGIMQGLPTPPHYPVPPPSGIHDHYNNGPTHELGY